MTSLHVPDAEIWILVGCLPHVIFSKCDTRLYLAHGFQRTHLPMLRNIAEPGDAGGFEGDRGRLP